MQTPDRIKALATEAAQAGDLEQVALCERALAGDAAALTECERVLARAAAQADDSERETTVRIRADAERLRSDLEAQALETLKERQRAHDAEQDLATVRDVHAEARRGYAERVGNAESEAAALRAEVERLSRRLAVVCRAADAGSVCEEQLAAANALLREGASIATRYVPEWRERVCAHLSGQAPARSECEDDCLTAAAAALRDEALLAGDIAMAVICEVASDGPETFRDDARYLALPHSERSELERLTRDEARAKVVAAIHNAEAQS